MTTPVVTIAEHSSYEEAARVLHDHHISGAPVVDDDGRVIGMISEKDLFRVLYPFEKSFYEHPELYLNFEMRENKIEEIRRDPITPFLTKRVLSIVPETPILKAGGLMLARGIHRLPVINETGILVGIVSRRDIFGRILASHLDLVE